MNIKKEKKRVNEPLGRHYTIGRQQIRQRFQRRALNRLCY